MIRRPARADDIDLLRDLHRSGLKEHVTALWGWDDTDQEKRLRESFDPARMEVLTREGADIGMVRVSRSPGSIRLDLILIDPLAQRQGIGSAVVGDLIREAREAGAELSLSVLRPNPAKSFYERLGFVTVTEDDIRFEMIYRPAAV